MQRGEAGEGAETRPGTGWACRTGAGTAWPPPLPWMPPPSAPPPCSVDAGGGFFERAGAKEEQMATESTAPRQRVRENKSRRVWAKSRLTVYGPLSCFAAIFTNGPQRGSHVLSNKIANLAF